MAANRQKKKEMLASNREILQRPTRHFQTFVDSRVQQLGQLNVMRNQQSKSSKFLGEGG